MPIAYDPTGNRGRPYVIAAGVVIGLVLLGAAIASVFRFVDYQYPVNFVVTHVSASGRLSRFINPLAIVVFGLFGFLVGWLAWPRRRNLPLACILLVVLVVFVVENRLLCTLLLFGVPGVNRLPRTIVGYPIDSVAVIGLGFVIAFLFQVRQHPTINTPDIT